VDLERTMIYVGLYISNCQKHVLTKQPPTQYSRAVCGGCHANDLGGEAILVFSERHPDSVAPAHAISAPNMLQKRLVILDSNHQPHTTDAL